MVHGIGKHTPGYSGRLRDNLASALGLDVVQEKFKEFNLLPPLDALQAMAQSTLRGRTDAARLALAMQEKTIPVYMLANQLPLLQLGFVEPAVTGKIPEYCQPTGEHYRQRLFKQVRIVAFSDPNDILSYALPPGFADRHLDSQIGPQVVNVTVNVAPVKAIPVVGELANPLAAHNDYEADERMIGLIAQGIGTPRTAPAVQARRQVASRPIPTPLGEDLAAETGP